MSTIINSPFSQPQPKTIGKFSVICKSESVRGNHREQNEDSVFAEANAGIFAVADGLGGQAGGTEASDLLCAVMAGELMEADTSGTFDVVRARKIYNKAIAVAKDGMSEIAQACPEMQKMGSTLAIGWIVDNYLYHGHVGDSRLYLLRNKGLTRLTKDHSLVQELCDSGAVAESDRTRNHWRHFVTRHVGPSARNSTIEVGCLRLRQGDRLIFVTDGITDILNDEAIRRAANIARNPAELCRWLQIAARNADAADDTSCVIVDIDSIKECQPL